MKKIFFLAICTSLLEIGYSQSEKVADDFRKLAWLGGTWVRTNAQTNETGNERWVKMSGSEWQGFGLTMNVRLLVPGY